MLFEDARDPAVVLEEHKDNAAVQALRESCPDAVVGAKFQYGELTLTIQREAIRDAGLAVREAGYRFLEDVTCVDLAPNEPRFQVVYHILSHGLKQRVRFHVLVGSVDPVVDSITPVWPSANFYEREVFDLFGVRFGGHPHMHRIMMPEDWEGHPLRKDYPVEGYR